MGYFHSNSLDNGKKFIRRRCCECGKRHYEKFMYQVNDWGGWQCNDCRYPTTARSGEALNCRNNQPG